MIHNKTFVSLTTIPKRLSSPVFTKHIKFLLSLTTYEHIVINIPIVSKSGELYVIPEELTKLEKNRVNFTINRNCKDEGPITKLSPSLRNPLIKNNDIIIVIDDDRIYKKNIFKLLTKSVNENSKSVSTFCFKLIQGVTGYGFVKKVIKNMLLKIHIPNECFKIDDYVLNRFVKHNKINIVKVYYTIFDKPRLLDKIFNNGFCNCHLSNSTKLARDLYDAPQLQFTTNRINANRLCNNNLNL